MNSRFDYSHLSDDQILRFATYESKDLIPEAFTVLYGELESRNLLEVLSTNGVKLVEPISKDDLQDLAIESLDSICPICNQVQGVNGLKVGRIIGVLIVTRFESEIVVGCRSCLQEEVKAANIYNLILGWWSIFGIFITPFTIISNWVKLRRLKEGVPSEEFRQYLKKNYECLAAGSGKADFVRSTTVGSPIFRKLL